MNAETPHLRLLLTTLASEEESKKLVRQLLEEQLIACGTLIPKAQSLYWWQGKIEEAAEVMVMMKTDEMTSLRCMERLAELHPYEVPEIILLDPERVSAPYAAWIKETLRKTE
jgi:periplasmic divalent cation tolerance protein